MKETYKSASEFLRVIISLDELLVNKLHSSLGAGLLMDLYTMVVVSPYTISSTEGHCNLDGSEYYVKGSEGVLCTAQRDIDR